jgi:hypothetical protein
MLTLFRGYTAHLNVTVVNEGTFTENFTVTAYANTTVIGTQIVLSLGPSNQTIVTFVWNASGYAVANYTLNAYATPVLGETDTADNSYTDGIIKVVIVGDINGDNDVDIKDVSSVAKAYGTSMGQPRYNPNGDFNDDHEIDIKDVSTTAKRYGDHYP